MISRLSINIRQNYLGCIRLHSSMPLALQIRNSNDLILYSPLGKIQFYYTAPELHPLILLLKTNIIFINVQLAADFPSYGCQNRGPKLTQLTDPSTFNDSVSHCFCTSKLVYCFIKLITLSLFLSYYNFCYLLPTLGRWHRPIIPDGWILFVISANLHCSFGFLWTQT